MRGHLGIQTGLPVTPGIAPASAQPVAQLATCGRRCASHRYPGNAGLVESARKIDPV